jgi:hypothetical protein
VTGAVEEALSVSSLVVEQQGRYVVYLDVALASGAVRRRLSDHPDRARAEVAAREYERAAARHLREVPVQTRQTQQ